MLVISAEGVGVVDWPPPFKYSVADLPRMTRAMELFISCAFSDREAWEALFTEEKRLEIYRSVFGNRKGKRRKARPADNRRSTK